ncbi:Transcriptional regulator KdgR [subsurface metagenome]
MDNTKAKTVEKALAIIEYLLKNEETKGITNIAKDLKINTSTVQRIVNTLHGENYLYQDSSSRKYKLGLKFLEISKNILKEIDLRRIASPYLRELRDQTGETVHLMVLDDSVGVYIDALESLQKTRVVSLIGTRDDLHCSAVGKAILAYLSDSEVERIAKIRGLRKITHKTITNLNLLKEELKKIRNQGYSIDDEEGEVGTRCIGAPIFRHNGQVNASISLAAPSNRLPMKKTQEYVPLMIETAKKISKDLGYINNLHFV